MRVGVSVDFVFRPSTPVPHGLFVLQLDAGY